MRLVPIPPGERFLRVGEHRFPIVLHRRRDADPSRSRCRGAHVRGGARRQHCRPVLRSQLADSTKGAYAAKWAAFIAFCETSRYPFLATTTETVGCYVGEVYERGAGSSGTIQHDWTPINAEHAMLHIHKPAVGPVLMAFRSGFAPLYAEAHDGLRNRMLPLPAEALVRMVILGLQTSDVGLCRRAAGHAFTARTFKRVGGRANLRHRDVDLIFMTMVIQMAHYNHGERTNRERLRYKLDPLPTRVNIPRGKGTGNSEGRTTRVLWLIPHVPVGRADRYAR